MRAERRDTRANDMFADRMEKTTGELVGGRGGRAVGVAGGCGGGRGRRKDVVMSEEKVKPLPVQGSGEGEAHGVWSGGVRLGSV